MAERIQSLNSINPFRKPAHSMLISPIKFKLLYGIDAFATYMESLIHQNLIFNKATNPYAYPIQLLLNHQIKVLKE